MKVLIANRGEIAVRVIRACRDMGLQSAAVYSDCDRAALHVRLADEAHYIGGSPAAESYLNIDRLVSVAARAGAELVHPGYGFLAENAKFAHACRDAGLTFIGPRPEIIALMGSKTAARTAAVAAGVPVVPGTDRAFASGADDATLRDAAELVGFPLLVKAVAGGGGKGMRRVAAPVDLASAVRAAGSEAQSAFGEAAIYFEREIVQPRHIEIQLLGDEHGLVIPFVERECSIQRRHQKVFEESPSPVIDPATRRAIADDAVRVARSVGYTNAGTIEFLYEASSAGPRWYFLEMNTRLQVEHPVTELVTGQDLVQWQIRIALGERLTVAPEETLVPRGHAMECRVYAEDPDAGFLPAPGLVREISAPGGPGVRDDRGVAAGFEIPTFYDSMIAKLIVWGESREAAAARLRRAIAEYRVVGVKTSLPFFRWLLDRPEFQRAAFDTAYLDRVLAERGGEPFVAASDRDETDAVIAAAIAEWHRASSRASAAAAVSAEGWRAAARRDALRASLPRGQR